MLLREKISKLFSLYFIKTFFLTHTSFDSKKKCLESLKPHGYFTERFITIESLRRFLGVLKVLV